MKDGQDMEKNEAGVILAELTQLFSFAEEVVRAVHPAYIAALFWSRSGYEMREGQLGEAGREGEGHRVRDAEGGWTGPARRRPFSTEALVSGFEYGLVCMQICMHVCCAMCLCALFRHASILYILIYISKYTTCTLRANLCMRQGGVLLVLACTSAYSGMWSWSSSQTAPLHAGIDWSLNRALIEPQ